MTLKHRLARLEEQVAPEEQIQVTVILRCQDDPETVERDGGVQVITVRLDTDD